MDELGRSMVIEKFEYSVMLSVGLVMRKILEENTKERERTCALT